MRRTPWSSARRHQKTVPVGGACGWAAGDATLGVACPRRRGAREWVLRYSQARVPWRLSAGTEPSHSSSPAPRRSAGGAPPARAVWFTTAKDAVRPDRSTNWLTHSFPSSVDAEAVLSTRSSPRGDEHPPRIVARELRFTWRSTFDPSTLGIFRSSNHPGLSGFVSRARPAEQVSSASRRLVRRRPRWRALSRRGRHVSSTPGNLPADAFSPSRVHPLGERDRHVNVAPRWRAHRQSPAMAVQDAPDRGRAHPGPSKPCPVRR